MSVVAKKKKRLLMNCFHTSDELMEAYRLGLKLTQIFNTYMSKDDALNKLSEWMREVR